ncbi:hypothetical protein ACLOJK_030827 [Asimina triloba]
MSHEEVSTDSWWAFKAIDRARRCMLDFLSSTSKYENSRVFISKTHAVEGIVGQVNPKARQDLNQYGSLEHFHVGVQLGLG